MLGPLAISFRLHLVGSHGPAPGSSVPAGVEGECVVVETWPPGRAWVGRRAGPPRGLATLSTAWLGIPMPRQHEWSHLDGRRLRIRLQDPVEGARECEAEVSLVDERPEHLLCRRRALVETWRGGRGEFECVLRPHPAPAVARVAPPPPERRPPARGLGRLLRDLPTIFRG